LSPFGDDLFLPIRGSLGRKSRQNCETLSENSNTQNLLGRRHRTGTTSSHTLRRLTIRPRGRTASP